MGRRPPPRALALTLAALTLAACAAGEAASPSGSPSTVGDVGALPGELPPDPDASTPTTAPGTTAPETTVPETTERTTNRRATTTTTTRPSDVVGPVGRTARGNRVLMIGDSILASTASRYTGEMCDRLVPMGWAVEIDAETGQSIDFGRTVLDRRLDDGWDAAVILLGTNYDGNIQRYDDVLTEILDELEPMPVLLLTVSEYVPRQVEVNYVIKTLGSRYDNVRILDWAERTARDERLLRGDDIHPSDEGRIELVSMIADELGRAPRGGDAPDCLPTSFNDDSN